MANKSDEVSDKSSHKSSEVQNNENNQNTNTGFRPEDDLIAPNLSYIKKEPKEDVDKYKNDYLYLLAEFDNYKKNMIIEI